MKEWLASLDHKLIAGINIGMLSAIFVLLAIHFLYATEAASQTEEPPVPATYLQPEPETTFSHEETGDWMEKVEEDRTEREHIRLMDELKQWRESHPLPLPSNEKAAGSYSAASHFG